MIAGKLVNLRAREFGDAERNARWSSDRELLALTGHRYPQSLAAIKPAVRGYASEPLSHADPRFAIETKDGVYIGNIRLSDVSSDDRHAQLSIMIGERSYWSKRYGSDAVRTLLRFAFREMNLHRVELYVYATNARAIAAYQKCGFVQEGIRRRAYYSRGVWVDVIVMSALACEWSEEAR